MSFHNTTPVKKTRKRYRCHWCEYTIDKGSSCVVQTGNYDGDFYSGRYHPECDAAISRWWKAYGNRGNDFPDWGMNRGGIEEAGEPETEPLDMP
jgi:hypothetical protein